MEERRSWKTSSLDPRASRRHAIQDSQTDPLFPYCIDDPVDRTDPEGLESPGGAAERAAEIQRRYEQTIEVRQEVTGSHIPQVVGTVTFIGNSAAVQSAAAALTGGNGFSVGFISGDKGAPSFAQSKTWKQAGNSVTSDVLKAMARWKREAWAAIGFDSKSNMYTVSSVFPGAGAGHLEDKYDSGRREVQVSEVTRGDLPSNYRMAGFVLGHLHLDSQYVQRDFRRAGDMHLNAIIVAPPLAGAPLRPTTFYYDHEHPPAGY